MTTSCVPPSLDVVQRLMSLPPAKRYSAAKLFDSLMDDLEQENTGRGQLHIFVVVAPSDR